MLIGNQPQPAHEKMGGGSRLAPPPEVAAL